MIPLTNIRRTIAERMLASVREAPQFTVSVDADMTRALAIVEDLKAGAAADQTAGYPDGPADPSLRLGLGAVTRRPTAPSWTARSPNGTR